MDFMVALSKMIELINSFYVFIGNFASLAFGSSLCIPLIQLKRGSMGSLN